MTTSKPFNEFINEIEKTLPDLAHSSDLIATGLFSVAQLSKGRRDGDTPPYTKVRGRYIYYKTDVLDWLKKNYRTAAK